MRYGFTSNGAFIVVDDARRISIYSHSASPNADRARRNEAKEARRIAKRFRNQFAPKELAEEYYLRDCRELAGNQPQTCPGCCGEILPGCSHPPTCGR